MPLLQKILLKDIFFSFEASPPGKGRAVRRGSEYSVANPSQPRRRGGFIWREREVLTFPPLCPFPLAKGGAFYLAPLRLRRSNFPLARAQQRTEGKGHAVRRGSEHSVANPKKIPLPKTKKSPSATADRLYIHINFYSKTNSNVCSPEPISPHSTLPCFVRPNLTRLPSIFSSTGLPDAGKSTTATVFDGISTLIR